MAKRKHGKPAKDDPLARKALGELIRKHPEVLHVLDEHGVTFCAGCYWTLFSPLERVAAYHAVPDLRKFLSDLRREIRR